MEKKDKYSQVLRWLARILSLLSLIAILLPFFVEGLYFLSFTTIQEWLKIILFLGVGIGLMIAWRWEILGGLISLACFVVFYISMYLIQGRFPQGPFLAIITSPAILFIIHGIISGGHPGVSISPRENST